MEATTDEGGQAVLYVPHAYLAPDGEHPLGPYTVRLQAPAYAPLEAGELSLTGPEERAWRLHPQTL